MVNLQKKEVNNMTFLVEHKAINNFGPGGGCGCDGYVDNCPRDFDTCECQTGWAW